MNDIVERLRETSFKLDCEAANYIEQLCRANADMMVEIERLRDENELLRDTKGCTILDQKDEIERLRRKLAEYTDKTNFPPRWTIKNELDAAEIRKLETELAVAVEDNDGLRAEIERLRAALQAIASCESHHVGDVVDIARKTVGAALGDN